MIKAEIKKNGNLYVFDLTREITIQEAYNTAVKLASGTEYFGDGVQIVDLGTSQEYDHIRVYEEGPGVQIEEPKSVEEAPDQNYIKPFEDRITYLGQDLKIKGIKAADDGVNFVLVYDINDQPAQFTAGKGTLEQITDYVGQVQYYSGVISIVAPADLHSEEDALEYVGDYIKFIRKSAGANDLTKNATAFYGFTKNEE